MVATTTETLLVNGVLLNTLAKNVESLTGRLRAPAYRTGNLVIPGKHGEMRVPNKKFQTNTIALPMWVEGCDDDGGIPGGSNRRRQFFANVDALVGLFKGPDPLDIRWTKADGTVRQCFAEVLEVMDFTTVAVPSAKVGVVLSIYDAFWRDLTEITQEIVGTGTTFAPTNFRGGNAPIEDMRYRITGPWSNPRITFGDGSWWQFSGTIPAGIRLVLDSGEWEVSLEGAPASYTAISGGTVTVPRTPVMQEDDMKATSLGNAAFVDFNRFGYGVYADGMVLSNLGWDWDVAKITHDGNDAYWGALPAPGAALTLAGGSRTAASKLELFGRRKYLVG